MDIIQLLTDHNIQYWTEGKNVAAGWVNLSCPFCGDDSNHLGFHLQREYFNCWKCGGHPLLLTLSRLLDKPYNEVAGIISNYGGHSKVRPADKDVLIGTKQFRHPTDTDHMTHRHRRYLESRGFDAEYLEGLWDLEGTGPAAMLDKANYSNRILVPIFWDGKEVSFLTRDITKKHSRRYMVCPKEREVIHHKNILYGRQEEWQDGFGICVEGVTDVWRLGPIAFATFGIEYSDIQVSVIAKNFNRVVVLYDDEPQAVKKANELVNDLVFYGVDARRLTIQGDPGGLKQRDADRLVRKILKGKI